MDVLDEHRRRLILLATLAGVLLSALDGTATGTSMPRIAEQLHGEQSLTWVVTAYLLASTVTIPVYGRLADLHGRKIPLLTGLLLFLTGSALCGLAQSMDQLVAFRVVQGIGAGALLTVGMTLARDLYPPDRSTGMVRMQTLMAGLMVVSFIGGPLAGGLITDHLGWRWVFLVNLPIGIAAVAVLAALVPTHHDPDRDRDRDRDRESDRESGRESGRDSDHEPARDSDRDSDRDRDRDPDRESGRDSDRESARDSGRFDVAGVVLLSLGISLILVALNNSAGVVMLAAGAALIVVFVLVERRASLPIVPLRLFASRTYSAVTIAGFLFTVASMPAGLFVGLYFQQVRGYSATASALMVIPLMAGMIIGNRGTALLVLRNGRVKKLLAAGALLIAAASAPMALLSAGIPLWVTVSCACLIGIGTAPAMGGIAIAAQNSVHRRDVGSATAGLNLIKQLGGSAGLAIGQRLFARHTDIAQAIGGTIAIIGVVGGILAFAAVLAMDDLDLMPARVGSPS
jgi:MFS family permease